MTPDPRGYYLILGLTVKADAAAIKAAYRRRAKDLHPDRNPAPAARQDFQTLTEAYRVLSDPRQRQAYDAGLLTGPAAPPPPPRSSHPPQPMICRVTRQVTAQPRYLVFPTVRGRGLRTHRGTVEGIFSREGAERTALKVALEIWLLGWWSLPWGPLHSLRALLVCLRGGDAPPAANYSLLMHQARAFAHQRDGDLARACALQALAFARTPAERRAAQETLRNADSLFGGTPGRQLRNRWTGPSLWRVAQVLPLLGLVALAGGLGLGLTPTPTPPAPPQDIALTPPSLLHTGSLYAVRGDRVSLHTGPGGDYRTLAFLERGVVVLVTENAPDRAWSRVLTADGLTGFVRASALEPGLVLPQSGESLTLPSILTPPPQTEPLLR